ncbi:MAG: hypothetical protein ACOZBL_03385 [Patescibacteria group bacterium]
MKDAVKNMSQKDIAEFEKIFTKQDDNVKKQVIQVGDKNVLEKTDDFEVFEIDNSSK